MTARLRSWWQQIQQQPVIAILAFVGSMAGIAGIALIVVVVLGYWLNWHWTGLVAETGDPKQHAKTLWDWLGLIAALAIPVVVGFGAALFTAQQAKVSESANTDNQREAALQGYIDKISELLLKEHLGERTADGKLKSEYEQVRNIARVRTLTTLKMLNGRRKGALLQFLYEAGLIYHQDSALARVSNLSSPGNPPNIDGPIIELSKTEQEQTLLAADLQGADLQGADLRQADLSRVNLREANLRRASLQDAYLYNADLSGADLTGADLTGAQFRGAALSGATMPDGSKHS